MTDMREVIATERLTLRLVRMEDAAGLYALFNNWNVLQWLGPPPWPFTREDMDRYLAKWAPQSRDHGEYRVIRLHGEIVGGIAWTLDPKGPGHEGAPLPTGRPNLGYWLGEPFWGQGIMSEAATALVAAIFSAMAVPAIASGVFNGNEASLRIQQKLGFVVIGENTVFCHPRRMSLPHTMTELTRETFEKNHR
jgi:RimJ/RimL family protein N-acetyltransferase